MLSITEQKKLEFFQERATQVFQSIQATLTDSDNQICCLVVSISNMKIER